MNNSQEAAAVIRKLTPIQLDVLGQIAMNDDRGHHPRTLAALEARGLIESSDETLGGRFPVRIKRYHTPTFVHIAWCAVMSERYTEANG